MALRPLVRSRRAPLLGALFVAAALLAPLDAQAQGAPTLEIVSLDTSDAPRIEAVLRIRDADGNPVRSLEAEDLALQVDGKPVTLAASSLLTVKDASAPVAVLVVFPIAKDYIEGFFGLRSNIASFLGWFRPIDQIGFVAYDSSARPARMTSGQDAAALAEELLAVENSEVIEPNLFSAIVPAIGTLRQIEDAQRVLVVVSNAEGAVVGDDAAAAKTIGKLHNLFEQNEIYPVIVGYTPDGAEELTYRKWLELLARDGVYLEATLLEELPLAMLGAQDAILLQYVFEAELDPAALEAGNHEWTIGLTIGGATVSDSETSSWDAAADPAP